MKKITLLAILFFAIFINACSSDDAPAPVYIPQVEDPFLRFTASGFNYDYDNPETIRSMQTQILAYEGINDDFRRVSLWMPNDVSVGTHQIVIAPASNLDAYTASYTVGDEVLEAQSGTLTVTAIDNEFIYGTYSFSADDFTHTTTIEVTQGSFKAYKP